MGDLFNIARLSLYLGGLYFKWKDYDTARRFFEQHLAIDRKLQFWDGIATALNNLGNLSRRQAELDEAESYYEESLSICRAHGLLVRDPMYSLGLLALQREQYSLAVQCFIGYFDFSYGEYDQGSVLSLLSGMAAAAAGSGQAERAARLWGAAQAWWRRLPAG